MEMSNEECQRITREIGLASIKCKCFKCKKIIIQITQPLNKMEKKRN